MPSVRESEIAGGRRLDPCAHIMHRIDTAHAQWCLTAAAAFRASLPAPGNGPGTQGIPAIAQDARARLDDPADGPLRLVRRGRHADLRGAYRLPLLVTGRRRDYAVRWNRGRVDRGMFCQLRDGTLALVTHKPSLSGRRSRAHLLRAARRRRMATNSGLHLGSRR